MNKTQSTKICKYQDSKTNFVDLVTYSIANANKERKMMEKISNKPVLYVTLNPRNAVF